MKQIWFLALVLLPAYSLAAGVQFDVTLTPAGDFTGKIQKVEGFATKSGTKVTATQIKVPLADLKTGVGLRDTHTKKHLEITKFPYAILHSAQGENGKGTATIEVKGIKKEVRGTYQIQGPELHAEFKVKISDFGIEDISYKGIGVDDEVLVKVAVPLKDGATPAAPAKPAKSNPPAKSSKASKQK